MWVKLFRAEFHKITGNRWVTGCMIWVFPILAVLFVVGALIVLALSSHARQGVSEDPALWTDLMIFPWLIPTNPIGKGILLGFTAVLFAGEYQWNTWKVVVPRSWRVPLILVKFLAVALFVVFAFTLMSVLLLVGGGLIMGVAGGSYGPSPTGEILSQFGEDYLLQMSNTFVATIIAAGYASLAAMITRSILGSVIVSVVATFVEGLLFLPLSLLAWLVDVEAIFHVYRVLPTYNLFNLFAWLNPEEGEVATGVTLETPLTHEIVVNSMELSIVILAGWVIGLIALTAYLFYKQDITN